MTGNFSVQSCPPPVALPIVFVPGIMGSRLRNRRNGNMVWDPDDTFNWPFQHNEGAATALARADAAQKRARMIGRPGAGFDPGFLEVDLGRVGGTLDQSRIDRGWGGVLQSFYLSFLSWLDMTAQTPAAGQVPLGCFNLHYEVWAHPYNWTDDNKHSGELLQATVTAAVEGTARKYQGSDIRVLRPVIVTHSMGGLVARAYTQLHGGAARVHGVIHGAMPTDGAPATYKRILAGFEGNWGKEWVMRHALGANQLETTATAANMPGALQLLPNTRHRGADGDRKWLKRTERGGGLRWELPASGKPYGEIYLDQTHWWKMIEAGYLDPSSHSPGAAFQHYSDQLKTAAKFHEELGPNPFHPNTRMFYSADRGHPAWDHVDWRRTEGSGTVPPRPPERNDHRGTLQWGEVFVPPPSPYALPAPVFVPEAVCAIQGPTAPGDGTVHAGSGVYVSGPMSVPVRRGFEHAECYDSSEVRGLVAKWLFAMVEEQL